MTIRADGACFGKTQMVVTLLLYGRVRAAIMLAISGAYSDSTQVHFGIIICKNYIWGRYSKVSLTDAVPVLEHLRDNPIAGSLMAEVVQPLCNAHQRILESWDKR